MENLTLEVFSNTDLELFEKWLNKDYIQKWYEKPQDWIYEIQHRNKEFSFVKHFITKLGNSKIGFCQYYDCYFTHEDWYIINEPNRTYSIDYLIGEEKYLHKGYGKETIKLLIEKVKTANGKEIIVQPDLGNIASQKILIANGFVFDTDNNYYCRTL